MSFLSKILKIAAERGAKTAAEDLAVKAARKAPVRAATTVVRKPKAVINFGLAIDADMPGGPGRVKAAEVKRAIRSTGRKIVQSEVRKSGTEPTLIALLDKPLTSEEMAQLTKQFSQKAMAHVDSKGVGVIDGQMKDAWDPYDAKYMMLPGGETVADLEPLIPAAPAALSARSGTPQATAADVLEDLRVGGKRTSYADWRKANPENGTLFDLSDLAVVPSVEQRQMPRYVPPRGPSERIVDALSRPEVARRIDETVERGVEGGGLSWYNTEPLRKQMTSLVPGIDAEPAYARMLDLVAATSPRAKVPDNVRTASYYNYLLSQGLPVPDKPAPGYGSVAQGLHTQNVRGVEALGGWDVFRNPKPASFSTNLQGNQQNVTVDTHNFRLPGILARDPRFLESSVTIEKGRPPLRPQEMLRSGEISMEDAANRPAFWATKPNANEYGYYEAWQQDRAKKMGISPAQYQASMWLGGGEDTGLGSTAEPFLATVEARIRYTADRLGMDPEKIKDMYLKGEIPLMAKGGRVSSLAVKG